MTLRKPAIIVDLDGTLCDVEHRVHHVRGATRNWKMFNELMVHDTLNHWCFEIIEAMSQRSYQILFVTGRAEEYRFHTQEWLNKENVKYDQLYMRGVLDQREDADVKEDIYLNLIEPFCQVLFVIDDRKSVVDRWRKLELVCLQCAPGNF